MASLTGSTIAASYEQLLSLPDGGLNGNTLVAITDGDSSTAIGMKVATSKIEIIPASDDANAFEVSKANGTAVLTVNTSTVGATLIGALTVGADDLGHDVIFYGDSASSNMTWDTSGDDLILNDSRLFIDMDDTDSNALDIVTEATAYDGLFIQADALTTGKAAYFYSNSDDNTARNLAVVQNNHASAVGATCLLIDQNAAAVGIKIDQAGAGYGLSINQDGNKEALFIDSDSTSEAVLRIDGPLANSGNVLQINGADALTTGGIAYLHSDSADNTSSRNLLKVVNENASADKTVGLLIHQNGADAHIEFAGAGNGGLKFGKDCEASDANTFDDYEEGVCDETLTDTAPGATFTLNGAYNQLAYTKVGRIVHITGTLVVSSISGTQGGAAQISLPFTVLDLGDASGRTHGVVGYHNLDLVNNTDTVLVSLAEGNATAQIYGNVDNGGQNSPVITSSTQLYFGFSYQAQS